MSLLQALKLPTPASPAPKAAPAQPASAAKAARLVAAAAAWRDTHRQADARIKALQAAVKTHCADAPAPLLQEIEKGLAKLDAVLATVDHSPTHTSSVAAQLRATLASLDVEPVNDFPLFFRGIDEPQFT